MTDPAADGERAQEQARAAYLDSASSEPLHPAAAEVLASLLERGEHADPRRLHGPGRASRLLLDNARAVTAEALGVRPDEVTFTTSGTDAVHRGLLGLVEGSRGGRTVVFSPVEHAAVAHAVAWGADPDEVAADELGRVSAADLSARAQEPGVAAVALQAANHEVGTVQPIGDLDLPGDVPLFTDACAAMGRLPLPDGWAVAAGSAHKWGGPAGVGVLLVRKGTRWRNPFPGDDRVDERSVGFENVPGALAAAAALQAVVAERDETNARQRALVDRIRSAGAEIPDTNAGSPTYPLDVAAALSADGRTLTVSVVNPTETAQRLRLDVRGLALAGGGTVWRMAPGSLAAANVVGRAPEVRVEQASAGSPEALDVPPISAAVYAFPLR